jgi:hypothetical protein
MFSTLVALERSTRKTLTWLVARSSIIMIGLFLSVLGHSCAAQLAELSLRSAGLNLSAHWSAGGGGRRWWIQGGGLLCTAAIHAYDTSPPLALV